MLNWKGLLLSIGDTDISEDVVGSFSLHASAVSTPVTDTFGIGFISVVFSWVSSVSLISACRATLK